MTIISNGYFYGNAFANVLSGTSAADHIYGYGGDDVLLGNNGNDWLEGGAGHDDLYGGNGDDMLSGGSGNDWLYGGDGRDTLEGGYGADTLYGGAGNDHYNLIYDYDTVIEYAGEGYDTVNAWFDYQLPDNVEALSLTDGAIHGFGNGLDNNIWGGSANNLLWGHGGNDDLFGGDGSDTLYGGNNDDYLDGGTGADKLIGGTGEDDYIVDNVGDVVTENANEGTHDAVYAKISYALANNVEYLFLIEGSGAVDGYGNALDNWINGTSGDNTLKGGGGHDVLHGFAGNDTLLGGSEVDWLHGDEGNDTLYGGDGDDWLSGWSEHDILFGGADNDTLIGGTGLMDIMNGEAGADTFKFASAEECGLSAGTADQLPDFSGAAGDKIDLSQIAADAGVAFDFIGEIAFTGAAGQVRHNTAGYVEGDINGDAIADFFIAINVALNPVMQDSAFVL